MNIMDIKVVEDDGGLWLKNEYLKLKVPESLQQRYLKAKDMEAVFGIRPEHIYDKKMKGEFEGGETLKVNIDVVEPVGKEIILLASAGALQFTICVNLQSSVRPHDTMPVLVDMNYMHLFNKGTGNVY